jgi:Sulfotransferase family
MIQSTAAHHDRKAGLMGNAEVESAASGRARIVYLAGIPRTGSTVLGHALATIPGVVFAGELNFFWRRFAQQEICSCGAVLPECPLWSAVVGKAFTNMTLDEAQALSDLEDRVVGKQRIFGLSPVQWPPGRNRDVRRMLAIRDDFYRSLAEITNASWIVDGGKEPIFARIMTRLSQADLYTVHLVRDPRGVAFSWMKRVRSDSEPRDMPVRLPVTSALEWMLQNLMVHVGLQRRSRSYIRVRYEDLVSDPIALVGAIGETAGLAESAS